MLPPTAAFENGHVSKLRAGDFVQEARADSVRIRRTNPFRPAASTMGPLSCIRRDEAFKARIGRAELRPSPCSNGFAGASREFPRSWNGESDLVRKQLSGVNAGSPRAVRH